METQIERRPEARRRAFLKSPGRSLLLGGRGLKNYLLNKPLAISFEITHACNANCRHCHLGGPFEENRATARDYGRICRELKPVIAQLSGGEPLLRRDLDDIVREFRVPNRPPYIVITTNAARLTAQRYAQLRQAGVDEFSISLDYPDERHDDFRGIPGLFGKIDGLIKGLSASGDKAITLCCVVQRHNFRDLPRLTELARRWGVRVNFSAYTPLRTHDLDYMISGAELEEFREIALRLLDFRKDHDTVFNTGYAFDNMIRYFERGGFPRCRTGDRFCNVNPDGTFSPCGLIITRHPTLRDLRDKFARTNTCAFCLTSIRSNCEKPLWRSARDMVESL